MSYSDIKRNLNEAARLIDAGEYGSADRLIRTAGTTRNDLDFILGPKRIAKMRKWYRKTADALRGKTD